MRSSRKTVTRPSSRRRSESGVGVARSLLLQRRYGADWCWWRRHVLRSRRQAVQTSVGDRTIGIDARDERVLERLVEDSHDDTVRALDDRDRLDVALTDLLRRSRRWVRVVDALVGCLLGRLPAIVVLLC